MENKLRLVTGRLKDSGLSSMNQKQKLHLKPDYITKNSNPGWRRAIIILEMSEHINLGRCYHPKINHRKLLLFGPICEDNLIITIH